MQDHDTAKTQKRKAVAAPCRMLHDAQHRAAVLADTKADAGVDAVNEETEAGASSDMVDAAYAYGQSFMGGGVQ